MGKNSRVKKYQVPQDQLYAYLNGEVRFEDVAERTWDPQKMLVLSDFQKTDRKYWYPDQFGAHEVFRIVNMETGEFEDRKYLNVQTLPLASMIEQRCRIYVV